MIINNMNIDIPDWISTRTYFYGENDSRTYIVNEKYKNRVKLDGVSSDFWFLIAENKEKDLYDLISNYKMENDVAPFLNDLYKRGLIISKAEDNVNYTRNGEENCKFDSKSEEEYIKNQSEWLYNNGFLGSIFLELTYRCNLNCIHCYNPKNISNVEIPFEKAKEIIDEAYKLGICSVTLSGGESTTYSHIVELSEYIRSKKLSLEVFTNGQLLNSDDYLYKKMVSLYPHRICLSLYSDKKEKHDKVTSVDGSFKKTLNVINKLRKDNIDVQIKNFLLNFACEDCINVSKIAESLKTSCVADISLIPTTEGDKNTFKYMLNNDQLYELFINENSPMFVGKTKPLDLHEIQDSSLCLGGLNGLCISPKLDVNICVSLPRPIGNLYKDSLIDIWNDAIQKKENSELFKWQQTKIKDLKDCYKEEYCKFCNYCAGMGYLENGYLKKSDILCQQAKAKYKAYIDIKKGK